MSRIGKRAIALPSGVKVQSQKTHVSVEGPKGKLQHPILEPITIEVKDNKILLKRPNDSIENKTKHGTMRSVIKNMVTGVTDSFTKKMIINGVGFKAELKGKSLVLSLGFTHPITLAVPEGLTVKVITPTEVDVTGSDKQLVGFFSAKIRSYYEPEPYKGKGIKYFEEVIRRKAGKTVTK